MKMQVIEKIENLRRINLRYLTIFLCLLGAFVIAQFLLLQLKLVPELLLLLEGVGPEGLSIQLQRGMNSIVGALRFLSFLYLLTASTFLFLINRVWGLLKSFEQESKEDSESGS
jgi:ABC-type long-subunit fatty acid transport system fused permease/ATPase subunit